jgi:hypothetical protein
MQTIERAVMWRMGRSFKRGMPQLERVLEGPDGRHLIGLELNCLFGDWPPPMPTVYRFVRKGSRLPDLLWTAFSQPLVSSRTVDLLTTSVCTGWRADRVTIMNGTEEMGGYFALSILGRCGYIDYGRPTRRELVTKEWNGVLNTFAKLQFDFEGWDGSDFVLGANRETALVCVSSKVVDLFKKHRVTGVEFGRVDEAVMLASVAEIGWKK